MSRSDIPDRLRDAVSARDDYRCQYCHLSQIGQAATFHIDHIWPRSRGGLTDGDNLAVQCTGCSLHKSDRTEMTDPLTHVLTPLFHPRRHVWADHLGIGPDGVCHGRTAIGRATVVTLGMNEDQPRIARSMQIAAGLLAATEEPP